MGLRANFFNFGREGGGGGYRYRGPMGAAIVVFFFFNLSFFFLIVFEMFFKIIIGCGMFYNCLVHIFNLILLKTIGWLVIFTL